MAQVKSALRITDAVDDGLLEMAVESASRAIDQYTNRVFYNAGTAVRYYAPIDSLNVTIDDLITLISLETMDDDEQIYDQLFAEGDYQLEPLNGYTDGLSVPFNHIRAIGDYTFLNLYGEATIKVTGVWGFAATPIQVTQATVIQASRIFMRLNSPLGIISGEYGSMRVGSRLDPDVAQLVDSFKIIRLA